MSKFVRVQKTQVRKVKKYEKTGNEGSPYWNDLAKKASTNENAGDGGVFELNEPIQANPDSLSETDGLYYVSEEQREKQQLVQRAIKLGKLSKRERQIVEMLTYLDKSQAEVADILGISQPVVSTYYKRAITKIKKYIEKESK